MVTRVGGLASGMDIDALVEKLMNAERVPLNKLHQNKQTYEWQREAYRGVNTKLKTFDTYIADNLVLKTLNSKTATSSNSAYVSATATGKASGTLSIEGVSQLATAARGVSDKQVNATGSTKVSSLFKGDEKMPATIELKAIDGNGKLATTATPIKLDANMTVDQLLSKINSSNAGVSAIFEQGKLSITAKNTGSNKEGEDEIQVTAGAQVFGKLGFSALEGEESGSLAANGQNARFMVNGIATERASNTFSVNGYNVTLKSTFNEEDTHTKFSGASQESLTNAQKNLESLFTTLSTKYEMDLSVYTTLAEKYNALSDELNEKATTRQSTLDTAKTDLSNARKDVFLDANLKEKYVALSDETKSFLTSLNDEQRAQISGADLTDLENVDLTKLTPTQKNHLQKLKEEGSADLSALADFKVEELASLQKPKTAGEVYDSLTDKGRILLSTMSHGVDISGADISEEDRNILNSLNETELSAVKNVYQQNEEVKSATANLNVIKSDVTDLVNTLETYNQAQTTVNNTGGAPTTNTVIAAVTMTSTTNIDDMMTKIKEFVATYNGLVKDLTDQTKQSKYRDYAPLTDEQKKEMSEDEIKLWEEKAKSGLLRNDSLIREGLSNMRALVYESNPAIQDPKFNTLFSIGVTTSKNYNEGGTLEIDETKLRKALEENPDAVEQLFKNTGGKKDDVIGDKTVDTRGYLEKLRESMKNIEINIEKKAGRSTMTDAQYVIGKNLMDVEDRIETWKDKLENIEARYWKQFTAMETAINKANQQSSLFMQG